MFIAELNATSPTSAAHLLNGHFNISDVSFPNSYWPITSWTLAGAIFPILLTPLIEDYGIRPGFFWTYLVFCISVIPQAVAQNFATLIVVRIFSGAAAATIAALVDGVAADLWEEDGVGLEDDEEGDGDDGCREIGEGNGNRRWRKKGKRSRGGRGRAVTVYTYFLLGGYTVGPIFGGAVIRSLDWRWWVVSFGGRATPEVKSEVISD